MRGNLVETLVLNFLALCLNYSLQDSLKRGAGVDGKLPGWDGPLLLHVGHQGDHIWVKVVSDIGLGYAPNI